MQRAMWSVLSVQLEPKVLVHTVYTIGNGVVCSARNARAKRMCRKRKCYSSVVESRYGCRGRCCFNNCCVTLFRSVVKNTIENIE